MQETLKTLVWSLSQEDPLEKGMAIHSSVLAWRIPQTEEPGGLWSIESWRVGHDWSNRACAHINKTTEQSQHPRLSCSGRADTAGQQAEALLITVLECLMEAGLLCKMQAPDRENLGSWNVSACMLSCFSCVQLFATLWTVAHQSPLPMGFSRQEHWSGWILGSDIKIMGLPPPGLVLVPPIRSEVALD